jgi:hypothetical protein
MKGLGTVDQNDLPDGLKEGERRCVHPVMPHFSPVGKALEEVAHIGLL